VISHITNCLEIVDTQDRWRRCYTNLTELTNVCWQDIKLQQTLQREAFCHAEKALKSLSVGASPRTPLGELTTLPQTHGRLGKGIGEPLPILLPWKPSALGMTTSPIWGYAPHWTYKKQIWHKGSGGLCNHLFQILSKSVKWYPGCEGPNMGVSHWLW